MQIISMSLLLKFTQDLAFKHPLSYNTDKPTKIKKVQ